MNTFIKNTLTLLTTAAIFVAGVGVFPMETLNSKNEVSAASILDGSGFSYTAAKSKNNSKFTDIKNLDPDDPDNYFVKWIVNWAEPNKITSGYSDGTFRPKSAVTRGAMAEFIWNLCGHPAPKKGKNPFSDVAVGRNGMTSARYTAILWGYYAGIMKGYDDGTFGPTKPCQRKHAITFLYRLADENRLVKKSEFKDLQGYEKTSGWVDTVKGAAWAKENGILVGKDGNCLPKEVLNRGAMITLLAKISKYAQKTDGQGALKANVMRYDGKFSKNDSSYTPTKSSTANAVATPTPVKKPTGTSGNSQSPTPTAKPTAAISSKPQAATGTPTPAYGSEAWMNQWPAPNRRSSECIEAPVWSPDFVSLLDKYISKEYISEDHPKYEKYKYAIENEWGNADWDHWLFHDVNQDYTEYIDGITEAPKTGNADLDRMNEDNFFQLVDYETYDMLLYDTRVSGTENPWTLVALHNTIGDCRVAMDMQTASLDIYQTLMQVMKENNAWTNRYLLDRAYFNIMLGKEVYTEGGASDTIFAAEDEGRFYDIQEFTTSYGTFRNILSGAIPGGAINQVCCRSGWANKIQINVYWYEDPYTGEIPYFYTYASQPWAWIHYQDADWYPGIETDAWERPEYIPKSAVNLNHAVIPNWTDDSYTIFSPTKTDKCHIPCYDFNWMDPDYGGCSDKWLQKGYRGEYAWQKDEKLIKKFSWDGSWEHAYPLIFQKAYDDAKVPFSYRNFIKHWKKVKHCAETKVFNPRKPNYWCDYGQDIDMFPPNCQAIWYAEPLSSEFK